MLASDNPTETSHCVLIGRLMGRITDKWTVLIFRVLGRGPQRFNAMRREIGEISQKVLAANLRDLEACGLVARTVTPANPPRVEYSLTPLGEAFHVPLRNLGDWVLKHADTILASQARFEAREPV